MVFGQLRALGQLRRQHLPQLQTIEDHDLAREIGYHQALGEPITLKRLVLVGIGSVATLQRRLRRLKRLGLVRAKHSAGDRRSIELTLSRACIRSFARYETVLFGLRSARESRVRNGEGFHVCTLCAGDKERRDQATRLLKEGFEAGSRCLVIAPERVHAPLLAELQRTTGEGLIGEMMFSRGEKTAEAMLEFLRRSLRTARSDGKRLR